ncbi:FAD-binding oxidoreductase [Bartonella sp. W8122]|uniref:NAD(P)/FAD-dependent oxidoreductase n=1 Tax=Bartonella sp. W8122 TaxID=2750930 RepID=UPI0018DD5E3F|nr:FAD-binding oxidoreductase [Bartonella sp. W8122]MBI0000837.1 FAD-binding oxidoreductase [Bartonella sp. W8122]
MQAKKSVSIIGGGIVGVATAAILSENGYDVTVIDRSGICEETSAGNAGAFAFTDVLPIASKGILRKLPGWMMDPLGPFTIRPTYLPKLMPWFIRFLKASRKKAQLETIKAQVAIMRLAEKEMMGLLARAELLNELGTEGELEVYESEKEFQAALPSWNWRESFGIKVRHIDSDELHNMVPGLSKQFVKASYVPSWRNVKDPKLFGKALWSYASGLGAKFIKLPVLDLSQDEGGVTLTTNSEKIRSDFVVVACGAWSNTFARSLGDNIPLDTERGYNTTLPVDSLKLQHQVTFGGHGFVVVPLSTGIRVGGAVEMGGLDLPPNYKRSQAMLKKAKEFFPDLKLENGVEWMGYRPSIPDGLPVIDYAKNSRRILYAFGHGHLGLTQSAATARLIHNLIEHKEPALSIYPFRAGRF